MMARRQSDDEHSGYGIYVTTYVALLVLTAITVVVAGMRLGNLSVLTALVIASVKAGVVLAFFMHLKYEAMVFKTMFFCAIGTFAIFIGLTFVDVLFR